MTPRRFDWLLRVRGPALSRWPAAERAAALALLHADARARDRLAALLDHADRTEAPARWDDPAALARMRRQLHGRVVLRATAAPALRWGIRGGALAACLVAGLWAGGTLEAERDPLATVQLAALDALR